MINLKRDIPIKKVADSKIQDEALKFSFFDECLPHDLFFGSVLLQKVQKVARQIAFQHAEANLSLKSIDFVRFYSTLSRDDRLFCHGSCNRAWEEMIEIGVVVFAEDFRTLEKRKIFSAYFTFQSEERFFKINKIVPESVEEIRRFLDAEKRRKIRYGIFKNSSAV